MGQVSAVIAHEVNQPLSAINNYLAVGQKLLDLETGPSDGLQKARTVMEKAAAQALRAGSIIGALRDFAEKREGSRSLQSLPDLVQEAVNLGMLGHKHGNIKLHMALDPATPPMVLNKVQIQQVLVNLVRNALDAMAGTAEPELGISLTVEAEGTTITVRDNGPGFPAEIADQLFQPFVTTKETGMGIGLRICQSIVEAHGGTIEAANTGAGALLVIRFPRGEQKEARA